jgi:hypothetical protein
MLGVLIGVVLAAALFLLVVWVLAQVLVRHLEQQGKDGL